MILYISDDGKLVNDPNFLLPVTALDFKRGDKTTIKLKFLNGTTPLAADPDRIIEFGCKPTGVYDTNFTVYADTYVIDTNDFYVFNPNFNTEPLNDLLNYDVNDTNDIPSVTLISEFTWSDDLGVSWNSTQTYNAIVANDVIRNDEDTPLINPSPVEWLCTNLGSLSCNINVTNPVEPVEGLPLNNITVSGYGATISTTGEYGHIYTSNAGSAIETRGISSGISTKGLYSPIVTELSNSPIYTMSDYSGIYTQGDYSDISTSGSYSSITVGGFDSVMGTLGDSSSISTQGLGSVIYTFADYSTIFTQGLNSHIYTSGNEARIYTTGNLSHFFTVGSGSEIYTSGTNSNIYTQGLSSNIYTFGNNSSIYTEEQQSHIYTKSSSSNIYTLYGKIGVVTDTPTHALDVNSNTIRLRSNRTIATATTAGTAGEVCFDANYIYRCVATNTWKRSPLTTW